MRKKFFWLPGLLGAVFLFLLASCTDPIVTHKYIQLDGGGSNGGYEEPAPEKLKLHTFFSTTELTNKDVVITISTSKSNISRIGYVYSQVNPGWNDAQSILYSKNFVSAKKDENGNYRINATTNGYYTIAARDSDGLTAYSQEYISYIDKTAPSEVKDLFVEYDDNAKEIYLSWVRPADKDFEYTNISYTKAGVSVVSNAHITNDTYILSDIEGDGTEYVFSVCAVDSAGNNSLSSDTSITAVKKIRVQSISLNRYHLAYNDDDQTVTAVANLSNPEFINDDTVIILQTRDAAGKITNTEATINKTLGTATAAIHIPYFSYMDYYYSETYTVLCKIDNDPANTRRTARFNVSSTPSVSGIRQSTNGYSFSTEKVLYALARVTDSTTETIRIQGYNLDLTKPAIQLYDSTGTPYYSKPVKVDTSAVEWTESRGANNQTIDTVINVPTADGFYTVQVLFDDVVQLGYSGELEVYDIPKFSSFRIPLVSITKEGATVTASVIGNYFDAPDVERSNFSATCTKNSNIVADTTITIKSGFSLDATFTIPGAVGEYRIVLSYDKNSITGILTVDDFGMYSVGDLLLDDGTIIPYDAESLTFTEDEKQSAVGILYGFNEYGVPAGYLGIYNSAGNVNSGTYQWAAPDTTGYQTEFSDIICTPSESYRRGSASAASFTGDTDGGDNWEYICLMDPIGTNYAGIYYTAFNYVNNYADYFGLTGEYADGWYMPCLAELCYIYRNMGVLNSVLSALNGVRIFSGNYWSSSQNADSNSFVWYVNMSDGNILNYFKNESLRICCVRAFSY